MVSLSVNGTLEYVTAPHVSRITHESSFNAVFVTIGQVAPPPLTTLEAFSSVLSTSLKLCLL